MSREHGLGHRRVDTLGQRRTLEEILRVIGAVGVVHLEANDLTTVDVQDQVRVIPAPTTELPEPSRVIEDASAHKKSRNKNYVKREVWRTPSQGDSESLACIPTVL